MVKRRPKAMKEDRCFMGDLLALGLVWVEIERPVPGMNLSNTFLFVLRDFDGASSAVENDAGDAAPYAYLNFLSGACSDIPGPFGTKGKGGFLLGVEREVPKFAHFECSRLGAAWQVKLIRQTGVSRLAGPGWGNTGAYIDQAVAFEDFNGGLFVMRAPPIGA